MARASRKQLPRLRPRTGRRRRQVLRQRRRRTRTSLPQQSPRRQSLVHPSRGPNPHRQNRSSPHRLPLLNLKPPQPRISPMPGAKLRQRRPKQVGKKPRLQSRVRVRDPSPVPSRHRQAPVRVPAGRVPETIRLRRPRACPVVDGDRIVRVDRVPETIRLPPPKACPVVDAVKDRGSAPAVPARQQDQVAHGRAHHVLPAPVARRAPVAVHAQIRT